MQRRLTAILAADVSGYSALMEADEAGTLARLQANRARIFDPSVAAHGGRTVKLMGDGALIEFPSVVAAVNCALAIQEATAVADLERSEAKPLGYRIGINLGDVIVEGDDIYGEGVNVAARLQSIAPVGEIAISATVREHVTGKVSCAFEDMGQHTVRNIERPIHVFVVRRIERATREAPSPETRGRVFICVLPFVNMSGDPEQEYFSDGIMEDILTDLTKVSALHVTARNTAFTFKGRHVDVKHVARQLSVSHVLEGSVRKAGDRVRITAQLADGSTGSHVWAERYDRDLNDIFALQDEISKAIVTALKLKLLPEEKKAIEQRGTANPDAYNLYLMARQFSLTRNRGDARRSEAIIRLCRRAIEIDPHYARPWALMASEQGLLRLYFGEDMDDGLAAAERATSLDPSLADAHAAKARILARNRHVEEAQKESEIALRLDPEGYEPNYAAGRLNFGLRRFAEAIPYLEKAAALLETDYSAGAVLVTCYKATRDLENARRAMQDVLARVERIIAHDPVNGAALGTGVLMLAGLGQVDRAKQLAERAMLLDPGNLHLRYDLACTYVELREFDAALDVLGSALQKEVHSNFLDWVKTDPDMDAIRGHPRFKEMLAAAETRLAQP